MSQPDQDIVALVADIVSAFVSHNSVPQADLTALIIGTHTALTGLGQVPGPVQEERAVPAVSIKKSITPEFLICLDDGKKFRSLKRHLRTAYDMTPDQYRAKWNLPPDYPMVAPAYAEARSQLAKKMGLGNQRRKLVPGAAAKRGRAKASA